MFATIRLWITGAIAALVSFGAAKLYLKGRKDANAKRKVDDLTGYKDTREKIDEADLGDDPDVLRDWLRARDPKQR